MGCYWLPKLGKNAFKKFNLVSNPLIAKCGSLLLWIIANPFYKIRTKK